MSTGTTHQHELHITNGDCTVHIMSEAGITGKILPWPAVPAEEAFRAQQLSLTQLGITVLRGDADWVALNPPDRWKGGVHLHPDKTIWRWDARQQTIQAS